MPATRAEKVAASIAVALRGIVHRNFIGACEIICVCVCVCDRDRRGIAARAVDRFLGLQLVSTVRRLYPCRGGVVNCAAFPLSLRFAIETIKFRGVSARGNEKNISYRIAARGLNARHNVIRYWSFGG